MYERHKRIKTTKRALSHESLLGKLRAHTYNTGLKLNYFWDDDEPNPAFTCSLTNTQTGSMAAADLLFHALPKVGPTSSPHQNRVPWDILLFM